MSALKRISIFLAILVIMSALQSGTSAIAKESPSITLLYPHTSPLAEANALMADKFKKYAEEKSGGKLKIEVMPAAQLGTAQETAQQIQDGSVHISSEQVYSLVDFIPEVSVFDMLFLFSDYSKQTIDKVINEGPVFEYLQKCYNRGGFKLLGYMQGATFRETTSNRELKKPADFKGMKIRTLPSNNFVVGWQSLGTRPTPITIGELYLSLQQKLVEAQENPYDIVLSNNFNEVQKYLCATHHNLYIMHIIVNKKYFDSLPADYQEALYYASKMSRKEIGDYMQNLAEDAKKTLIARGMTFIEYDKNTYKEFKKMSQPAWGRIRKISGNEVVDMMIKELESISKK